MKIQYSQSLGLSKKKLKDEEVGTAGWYGRVMAMKYTIFSHVKSLAMPRN
jgi:hypothetical protein